MRYFRIKVCQMPGGAIANLWCSFAAKDLSGDPWTVVYKILGTRGAVAYSWNEAQFEDDHGPGWGLVYYEESFHNEIAHFMACCMGGSATSLDADRSYRRPADY